MAELKRSRQTTFVVVVLCMIAIASGFYVLLFGVPLIGKTSTQAPLEVSEEVNRIEQLEQRVELIEKTLQKHNIEIHETIPFTQE